MLSRAQMTTTQRHYGLDWLRIAAFAVLIVYHVAMVFAPWDWVIKTPHSYPALIAPMAAITPWRLALLFAVSGYASRKLFERSGGAVAFARARNVRLLVPLLFGMTVIVPPEMWVRAMERGYSAGLLHFWAFDYWANRPAWGQSFPSWEHLWFVAYLWFYTMVLAGVVAWIGAARLQRVFERVSGGDRILWVPMAGLIAAKVALMFVIPEHVGLTTDWLGHIENWPVFAFGFALGGSERLWAAVVRVQRPAAVVAVLSGVAAVLIELRYQGHDMPGHAMMAFDRASRVAMAWSMILLLFHLAETHWNRDHTWRATLSEAVFPFYLIHHPVIVLLAWWTLPWDLNPWVEFALLLSGTVAACLAFYLGGRRVGWLRPLIGLRAVAPAPRPIDSAGFRAA